jgi:membrane-bound lytic murein transglycosylase D
MRRTSFRAGKRDTVAAIARRYRVSPQQVAQWNRTSPSASFHRGQTVVVYVPVRHGRTQMANNHRGASRNVVVASKGKVNTRLAASNNRNVRARPNARNAKVRVASR